jgi:hypothetical protein
MIDLFHLPKPQNGTIDYFPGFSTSDGGQWEVWNKPRGCIFIRILCIGGGGGGGAGFASATTNARGGGGGGGSSAMTALTIPAVFLPDRLYVSSGVGGGGGTGSGSSGGNGVISEVCVAPANVNIYILCYSNPGNGGTGGTSSSTSPGGSPAANQAVITTANQGFQGHFNGIAGQIGGNGGAQTGANGTTVAYPVTGLLLSGGAGGGGGAGFTGGNITAPSSQTTAFTLFQTQTGGVAGSGSITIGGDGGSGVELYQPLLSTGGSGGGSSFNATAQGGNGGEGRFGSGGGGGGAGGTDGAGAGGDGGPGLIIIHTW